MPGSSAGIHTWAGFDGRVNALVRALRKTTPNNWNRYWQDRAFWTIWRNGEGAGHWRGGGLNCF